MRQCRFLPERASHELAIKARGGLTIAQSQGSSFCFEMPCGAIDLGKVEIVLPPARIAEALAVLATSAAELMHEDRQNT